MQMYGTLKGLEQSMNPQLMKYARETDISVAIARRENRRRLFSVYPHMPVSMGFVFVCFFQKNIILLQAKQLCFYFYFRIKKEVFLF